MELQQYNLVIAMIIFHELAHAFTKTWFLEIITPLGVGVGNDPKVGEAGKLVEGKILGGILRVEWDDKSDMADMDYIDRVLLTCGSQNLIISKSIVLSEKKTLIYSFLSSCRCSQRYFKLIAYRKLSSSSEISNEHIISHWQVHSCSNHRGDNHSEEQAS